MRGTFETGFGAGRAREPGGDSSRNTGQDFEVGGGSFGPRTGAGRSSSFEDAGDAQERMGARATRPDDPRTSDTQSTGKCEGGMGGITIGVEGETREGGSSGRRTRGGAVGAGTFAGKRRRYARRRLPRGIVGRI